MPSFPWTKSELTNRLRAAPDWWVDSILVFDDREVFATEVTREGEQIHILGWDCSNHQPVDEVIDPRTVKRVVH